MKTRRSIVLAAACIACSSPGAWNGEVHRWGTLRDVLRDGQVAAKVSVAEASASPLAVGLGALADLAGEVTVLDGTAWVARAGDGEVTTTRAGEEAAALLFLAEVPQWREVMLEEDVDLERLEVLLEELGPPGSGKEGRAFPFVLEGELEALDSHVLAGACPQAGDVTPQTEPLRRAAATVRATLVGFYSELGPGVLTHHGTRLHVHVLETGAAPYTGHVDAVRVPAGARLRVPR